MTTPRPRDTRTFIRLHDGMPEHPKVESLSDAAFRALVDLWCWCSRNRTDGKIREAVWVKRAAPKVRKELLTVGMVHEADDGVEMHDYLDHQRSAAEIEELTERRRQAGSKGGKAKALASAKANAKQGAKQTASKSLADTDTEVLLRNTTSADAADRPDVEHICNLLADLIAANTDKRPNITKGWRDEARRLIDTDGRTPSQIKHVARWATTDSFWKRNILSMPTLRKKYDQLLIAAREDWRKNHDGTPSPDGQLDVDSILGRDLWTLPAPPEGIEPGTPAYRTWASDQRAARRAKREAEARAVIERRGA